MCILFLRIQSMIEAKWSFRTLYSQNEVYSSKCIGYPFEWPSVLTAEGIWRRLFSLRCLKAAPKLLGIFKHKRQFASPISAAITKAAGSCLLLSFLGSKSTVSNLHIFAGPAMKKYPFGGLAWQSERVRGLGGRFGNIVVRACVTDLFANGIFDSPPRFLDRNCTVRFTDV